MGIKKCLVQWNNSWHIVYQFGWTDRKTVVSGVFSHWITFALFNYVTITLKTGINRKQLLSLKLGDNDYVKHNLWLSQMKSCWLSCLGSVNEFCFCRSLIVRCCFKVPRAYSSGAGFTHEESGGIDTNCWICQTLILFFINHVHVKLNLPLRCVRVESLQSSRGSAAGRSWSLWCWTHTLMWFRFMR